MFDDVGHPAFVLGVIYGIPTWAAHAAPRWKYGNQENFGLIVTSVFAIPAILGSPCRPQKAGLADD